MNALNLVTINTFSPYLVWSTGDVYYFETEHGVEYSVDFDLDDNPYFEAYWVNLNNLNRKVSPGDVKIAQTLICIIEEFFRQNPQILLYMCSRKDDQQAQRARLFLRWFKGAEQQQKYLIKATDVKGETMDGKNIIEYVAMIVPRSHPHLDDVVRIYEEEIQLFNEMKP